MVVFVELLLFFVCVRVRACACEMETSHTHKCLKTSRLKPVSASCATDWRIMHAPVPTLRKATVTRLAPHRNALVAQSMATSPTPSTSTWPSRAAIRCNTHSFTRVLFIFICVTKKRQKQKKRRKKEQSKATHQILSFQDRQNNKRLIPITGKLVIEAEPINRGLGTRRRSRRLRARTGATAEARLRAETHLHII